MDPLFLLVILLFGVGLLFYAREQKRKADAAWASFAREHGLHMGGGAFKRRSASGLVDGLGVQVYEETRSAGKSSTTWTLVEVDLGAVVSMTPEGMMSTLLTAMGGEDVQLGHPEIDRKLVLKGDEVALRAMLDKRGRAAAAGINNRLQVRHGKVRFETQRIATKPVQLDAWLAQSMDLAKALSGGGRPALERLADVAAEDPHPVVAQRALELVLSRAAPEQAEHLARRALTSHHAEVRCTAAARIGDLPALHALLEPGIPESIWPSALAALAVRETPIGLRGAIASVLARTGGPALAPTLHLVHRHRVQGLVEPLLELARTEQPSGVRAALAQALRWQGQAGQVWLVAQLDPAQPVAVRIAAAQALGEVGDISVVAALHEAEGTVGLTQRRLLAHLREAIARIQEREGLDGALAGAVALSDTAEAGGLSLAQHDASPRAARRRRETQ